MRLNKNAFFGEAARDFDPDILYYLKTSKPHIGDITISGPYYPIDNMIEQIRWRLSQENSPQGSRTFEELLEAPGIGGIEHLNAPLPDGEVMRLQIQRERNAEVAAALRGRAPGTPLSTYKVYETVPDPSTHDANYEHEEDFVPLREANIHATFTTKEAATRSATDLVKEWERRWPDCRGTTMMQDGLLAGGLVGPDREMRRMFQVMHDDGRKQYADGSVGY